MLECSRREYNICSVSWWSRLYCFINNEWVRRETGVKGYRIILCIIIGFPLSHILLWVFSNRGLFRKYYRELSPFDACADNSPKQSCIITKTKRFLSLIIISTNIRIVFLWGNWMHSCKYMYRLAKFYKRRKWKYSSCWMDNIIPKIRGIIDQICCCSVNRTLEPTLPISKP